jgi:hypothetical protein
MERHAKAQKLTVEAQVLTTQDPQAEMQMKGQEAQQKMQMQGAQAQQKMQIDQAMAEQKMSAAAQKSEQEMMHQVVKDRHDMAVARIQAQNKVMQQPNPNLPATRGAGVGGAKPSVE